MSTLFGLILDVDGVIADTEAVNAVASIKVFEELFDVRGVQREDFAEGLGRGAEEYVKSAARVHGLELSADQVALATKARQENFLRLLSESPLRPLPGVLELIDASLRRRNLRVAIATSSTREKSEAVLRSANIPYKQMAYITGSDVTYKKPHPELFLAAAKSIDVDPQLCVVIEDAPNGVQAARAAGCKCIAVTNTCGKRRLDKEAPDLIVETLSDVTPEVVMELLGGHCRES